MESIQLHKPKEENDFFRSIAHDTNLSQNSIVFMGHGSLDQIPFHVSNLSPDKIFILADDNVSALYHKKVASHLNHHKLELLTFKPGEENKNFQTLEDLASKVLNKGITKKSLILTLGGGVTLNLGGMLASLLFRGIAFAHIPTNFMGQTDVVLSNKQGVNTSGGKNLLGLYSAPAFSIVDTDFLKTEPKRNVNAGIVESLKNALILKSDFYDFMNQFLDDQKTGSKDTDFHELVLKSFEQKLKICKKDPSEKKLGLSLEYGHTIGHAIEILSKGKLLHGEAVFIGMLIAADISLSLGIMNSEDHHEHQSFLKKHKLETKIPSFIKINDILKTLLLDNKKVGDNIAFVLLRKRGKLYTAKESLLVNVPEKIIKESIAPYLSTAT